MPERSRLRELIDRFTISGHDKSEIDLLLAELERSAKAMGAYEAGRDHAPAIAQLFLTNTQLSARVAQLETAIRWACGDIPAPEDGKWFGDVEDEERLTRGLRSTRRRYWWRRRLRLMAAPLPASDKSANRCAGYEPHPWGIYDYCVAPVYVGDRPHYCVRTRSEHSPESRRG